MTILNCLVGTGLLVGFRTLVLGEEGLPLLPPLSALKIRASAVLFGDYSGDSKMPPKARAYSLFRLVFQTLLQGFMTFMWTLDDLLTSYRSVEIKEPVFIVGGFRTGSTSLHRVLALDEERYISPRFLELAMPFLTFHYLLDFLGYLDNKIGTQFIVKLEEALKAVPGPDVMARHPMSYYAAEEDDVLLSACQYCGYYTITQFPSVTAWVKSGNIEQFSSSEKKHLVALYRRSLQKVLYRRGGGRTLLSKSHLIDCVQMFDEAFEGAKFIDIVRHPKDVVPSWIALAQAAAPTQCAGWQLPTPVAVDAHLKFWDLFLAIEKRLFVDEPADNRVVMPFKPFIKTQMATIKGLYKQWGLPFDGTAFEKRLIADQEAQKDYKKKHNYTNPTLEELGITAEQLSERYASYIKAMNV